MTRIWEPGQQVLLRSVEPDGKVHSARPVTVVSDDGHVAALQLVVGTPMIWPEFGDRADLLKKFAAGEWRFVERTWTDNHVLILLRDGDAYSPQMYRSADATTRIGELIDDGEAWWAPWRDWEPDLTWPVPELPHGWDVT